MFTPFPPTLPMQVLQAFPYATTCTLIHLMVASAFMSALWLFRCGPSEEGAALLPCHTDVMQSPRVV